MKMFWPPADACCCVVYVRLESPSLARNFKSALDLTFTRTYTCEWTECEAMQVGMYAATMDVWKTTQVHQCIVHRLIIAFKCTDVIEGCKFSYEIKMLHFKYHVYILRSILRYFTTTVRKDRMTFFNVPEIEQMAKNLSQMALAQHNFSCTLNRHFSTYSSNKSPLKLFF